MRALVLVAILGACNAPDHGPRWRAAGGAPRAGGTLHVALNGAIGSLDPTVAYDDYAFLALHPLFDTLLDYAPGTTDLVPRLAERWEIDPAGTTLRFTLRPGLRYADGTPIVAADLKYSLERALTTADSPFGSFLVDIVGAQAVLDGTTRECTGLTAPSDHELVIVLAAPNMAFPYVLAMPFTTPQRADHVRAEGDQLRRRPLATGPYELASWDEGEALVLRANPRYDDVTRNRIAELELREDVPRETQLLLFEAGDLDTVEHLSAPDLLWISSEAAWQPYLHRRALMNAYGSRLDVRVAPFSDVRVRQALNYALDKDHITKLLTGTSVPAHGILAPGMLGRDETLAPYPHDPVKARALLAAAGYPDGFDTTYATTDDLEAGNLASSLAADLADVGVRVHVQQMSFATYATALGRGGTPFGFVSWVGDYPDPSNFLDARFHSRSISPDNSLNASWYANPVLDALLDHARAERDPQQRGALYRQAERILYDDAPWVWGYHQGLTEVTQPYVRDYEPHPVWGRDYTRAWLDLDEHGERVSR